MNSLNANAAKGRKPASHDRAARQAAALRGARRAAVLLAAVLGVTPAAFAQVRPATAPASPAAPAAPAASAAPATRPAGDDQAPRRSPSSTVADLIRADDLGADGKLHLTAGRSVVLKTRAAFIRVANIHPEVVADNEVDATGILLQGKHAGEGQVVLWDEQSRSQSLDVVVDVDLPAIEGQLRKNFPGADIRPTATAGGTIVLNGRVPNLQTAEQVSDLMGAYGKVLNFLQVSGGQQIMLKVRFAEVSRSASSELGFNTDLNDGKSIIGFQNGPGPANTGQLSKAITGTSISPAVQLFGAGQIGHTAFESFLDALRSNNLLRVLAEPDLVTSSGQEANFLAGGEFPIPIPQAGGSGAAAITVDYKQYGVRLSFVPVALGDGKIRLKVSPEVSDLDYTNSVSFNGFTIPSLTKRNLSTTIEMKEGQTFAVAGLLNTRLNASKSVTPLLGDIPVVGALFRSVRYQRSETELVVLVTPQLVEAMNPGQVPDAPGEHWQIPTENDLFLNAELGGPGAVSVRHPASMDMKPGPAQYFGPYGFTPADR